MVVLQTEISPQFLQCSQYKIAKFFLIESDDQNGLNGSEVDVGSPQNPESCDMVRSRIICNQNHNKDCNEQDCVENNNENIDDGFIVFFVVDFLFWLLMFITDHNIDTLSYFLLFPVGFKPFHAASYQSNN